MVALGGTELWLQDESGIHRHDFADPARVKTEAVAVDKVPPQVRDALGKVYGRADE